jgi:hypothetical protein
VERVVVGLHDYYSGLADQGWSVTADFPLEGAAAGTDLAARFQSLSPGVWELKLAQPIRQLARGTLTAVARDRQGNETRLARTFSVGQAGQAAAATPETRPALVEIADGFPARVHVCEDFETYIERRWWLRGTEETKDLAPRESRLVPNQRALRGSESHDFDDRQGDPSRVYRAVVFNPVPGPPVGSRTRLRFRYRLAGTDRLRVQIYSLTNNYHRRAELSGLRQGEWALATVDMTALRRPDGTGGPLSADERIDDIQFYVAPPGDVQIDDIVLYEAGPEPAGEPREPFPARIVFTGWFDTGQQGSGREWPGLFSIVPHEPPRTWKAAQSEADPANGQQTVRIDLRGRRPVGGEVALRLVHRLSAAGMLRVELRDTLTGGSWSAAPLAAAGGQWEQARAVLQRQGAGQEAAEKEPLLADQLELAADAPFQVDDVLLFEPGQAPR